MGPTAQYKYTSVKTLRVRYAELLRLRERVRRMESPWHDTEQRRPSDEFERGSNVEELFALREVG